MKQNQLKFSTLRHVVVGGSACPPAMITAFREEYGVRCQHAWGMTEMSPLGSLCTLKGKHAALSPEERFAIECKQGRAIYGVEMKIVDGEGRSHRSAPPEVGRAAARDRGQEARREPHARGAAQALRGQGGEVVHARRRDLRRAAAAHRHREAPEDEAAAGLRRIQAAGRV